MSSLSSVPAVQYEIKVYEGAMDFVHGGGRTIKEVFIPSRQVGGNTAGFAFHAEKPRIAEPPFSGETVVVKPLKEIQVPFELACQIASLAQLQLKARTEQEAMQSSLQRFLG